MPSFYDHFNADEDLAKKRDEARALANEWQGKLLTSFAAVNGAGFVTLTTYLASKLLGTYLILAMCAAAVFFLVGLAYAATGLIKTQMTYEIRSAELERKITDGHIRKHGISNVSKEEEEKLFQLMIDNENHMMVARHQMGDDVHQIMNRTALWFVAGLVISFACVVIVAFTAPSVGAARSEPSITTSEKPTK